MTRRPVATATGRSARRARAHIGAAVLLSLVLAVLVWGCLIAPARLVKRDYTIPLAALPAACDGLRLDVIADTHTGSPRNGIAHLDRVVQALMHSNADAVLMAGDYVILSIIFGQYVTPQEIARHLQPLAARKPVYAVLGNHDWWKDAPGIRAAFSRAGIRMIDNDAVQATFGRCRLWLVGLGDLQEGRPDIAGAFGRVTSSEPVIALTHEPDLWPRLRARAMLTVAGHTHGGQVHPWPRESPGRFVQGSHTMAGWIREGSDDLFVSPGIGTSIVPMRLGVPPEISRLTLRRAPATR